MKMTVMGVFPVSGQWVTRDHRWQPGGTWDWAISYELPQPYRELNGIDFGHAPMSPCIQRSNQVATSDP